MSDDRDKHDAPHHPVDPTRVPSAPEERHGERPGDMKPSDARLPPGTPGQVPPPDKSQQPHGPHNGFAPKRKP